MTDKKNLPWQLEELRDKFAMAAMQGILANPAQLDNVNDKSAEWVSRDAHLVADAMLKARGGYGV